MPSLNPDHLYKMPRMNKAFALSSVALLLVLVWMVAADYVRDWKLYQAEFNRIDVEKTEEAIQEADAAVDPYDLEDVKTKMEAATAQVDASAAELEAANADLAREDAVLYRVDQAFRFAKADLDALKFEVEEARAYAKPNLAGLEAEYEENQADLEEKRQALLIQQEKMDGIRERIAGITKDRDDAQKEYDSLYRVRNRLDRKLGKITPDWRRLALNLPMLDFVQPTLKVNQVILPDLKNDVNFLEIPRVDRCMTCHVGINQKGFEDQPQPFATHPRLDLFVGDSSNHPMGSFGCTTCHYGQDRGTSFYTAAHTPRDEEQKQEWEERYGWEPLHHWDEPMLPMQYIEASCRKCHVSQVRIPEADKINRGLQLVERFGCYGCHKLEGFETLPKVGPDLRAIGGKLTPEWTIKWIKSPRSFRPSTRMPHFWDLTNTSTPEYLARNNVEADAIVSVLFEKAEPRVFPPPPLKGDPVRGEQLVQQVGCMGCHRVGPEDPTKDRGALRQFGPELNQVGSKVTPGWLYAWLKSPTSISPTTRMPSLRLSDQEAADITSYLIGLRNEEFDATPPPAPDPALRDEIVVEYLSRKLTDEEAREKVASMSEQEKRLFLGDKFINRYGCFGCHLIEGYENAVPIGTELSKWASKYVDQLDFGLLQKHETEPGDTIEIADVGPVHKVESTKQAWAWQKLKDTRIFDLGRVRKPEEKLKMPLFAFSDEETQSLVTALMSFTKERIPLTKLRRLTPEEAEVEKGRRIVLYRNCHGCHEFHGTGGEVRGPIERSLVRYEGRTPEEARAVAGVFSPPILDGEGAKVNPEWFFNFLKGPTPIRPWLKIRMPSFNVTDDETNAIITHFARHDGARYPFQSYSAEGYGPAEKQAALQLVSKEYFNCFTCHQQGDRKPAGPVDSWAPDLTMARSRLRADWIAKWLHDPQRLQPGTKMPTFYDPDDPASSAPQDVLGGDPEKQIGALRDYIYSIGNAR